MSFSILDISMLLGGFLGGIVQRMLGNSHEFKMAMAKQYHKDVQRSREVKDEYFKWTRRVIAITATAYVFLGPLAATYFGYPSHISYIDTNGFFVSLFSGDTSIRWESLPSGYVLLPVQRYAFEAIIGLYFGVKRY